MKQEMTQKIKVLLFIIFLLVIVITLYYRSSTDETTPVIENKGSIDDGTNASIINSSQNETGNTENSISIPLEKPPANIIGG